MWYLWFKSLFPLSKLPVDDIAIFHFFFIPVKQESSVYTAPRCNINSEYPHCMHQKRIRKFNRVENFPVLSSWIRIELHFWSPAKDKCIEEGHRGRNITSLILLLANKAWKMCVYRGRNITSLILLLTSKCVFIEIPRTFCLFLEGPIWG